MNSNEFHFCVNQIKCIIILFVSVLPQINMQSLQYDKDYVSLSCYRAINSIQVCFLLNRHPVLYPSMFYWLAFSYFELRTWFTGTTIRLVSRSGPSKMEGRLSTMLPLYSMASSRCRNTFIHSSLLR